MSAKRRIPLSGPDIGDGEIAAVLEVLHSGRLSLGPWKDAFEEAACATLGTPHAVAVSSGTAALDCALRALGIGPGDEVITTPFSFVASANAILHVGATPVFVDIDAESLNIDVDRIEERITEKTRALLIVHVFGRPTDMDAVLSIAERHGLRVIEDACEAIGARHGDRAVGTMGDAGVFGFYPNKAMTTGEGGLLVTADAEVAASSRALANQGRRPGAGWLEHVDLGFNYRLSELHAALGAVQMRRLDELLERRRTVVEHYDELLARMSLARPAIDGLIRRPSLEIPGGTMSWFVYVVRTQSGIDADAVAADLRERGVDCGRYFPPIHLLPFWRERFGTGPGDYPVTEGEARRTIALPFCGTLPADDQKTVCDALAGALADHG